MTPEEYQAQLLEAYLNALADKPDAPLPAELDPETAMLARTLHAQAPQAPPGAQERVWQRMQSAAQLTYTLNGQPEEEDAMTVSTPTAPQRGIPLTLVAAVFAVVLMAGLLMAAGMFRNDNNNMLAVLRQQATPTAPLMTMTPAPPTSAPPPTQMSSGGGGGGGQPPLSNPRQSMDYIFSQIPPQPIEFGRVYSGETTLDAPYVTFSYTAPEDMSLVMLAETDNSSAAVSISVRSAPDETPFGGGGGGGGGGGPLNPVNVYSLNAGDQFRVAVQIPPQAQSNQPTDYQIEFRRLVPTSVEPGEEIRGQITDEMPYRAYQFPITAADIVTIAVSGVDGFDPEAQLRNDADIYIGSGMNDSDDDGGPGYDAELYRRSTFFDTTGVLIVTSAFPGARGAFDATITIEAALDISEGAQTVRLSRKQPDQTVRALGEPGTTGTVSVRPLDGDASLALRITDGESELTSTRGENVSRLLREFVFPASGEVYVNLSTFQSMGGVQGPSGDAVKVVVSLLQDGDDTALMTPTTTD